VATHYDTLGLTPAATHDEVRQAYIERALRHHPDRHEGLDLAGLADAGRRMQDVNDAWGVLGDREARAAYDGSLGIGRDDDGTAVDLTDAAGPGRPPGLRATLRRFRSLFVVLGLLVAFFVFTAYAGGPPPS
jgi:DnaJ-class molecular chaperone